MTRIERGNLLLRALQDPRELAGCRDRLYPGYASARRRQGLVRNLTWTLDRCARRLSRELTRCSEARIFRRRLALADERLAAPTDEVRAPAADLRGVRG